MHLTLKIAVNKFLIFLFIGELINHVLKGLRLMWNIKNYFKTIELTEPSQLDALFHRKTFNDR